MTQEERQIYEMIEDHLNKLAHRLKHNKSLLKVMLVTMKSKKISMKR